jgi:hypothetical protein
MIFLNRRKIESRRACCAERLLTTFNVLIDVLIISHHTSLSQASGSTLQDLRDDLAVNLIQLQHKQSHESINLHANRPDLKVKEQTTVAMGCSKNRAILRLITVKLSIILEDFVDELEGGSIFVVGCSDNALSLPVHLAQDLTIRRSPKLH